MPGRSLPMRRHKCTGDDHDALRHPPSPKAMADRPGRRSSPERRRLPLCLGVSAYVSVWVAIVVLLVPAVAAAQEIERVTFDEAVRRAVAAYPTVQQAAADVLRANAILQQVRARSLPTVDASFTTNII